MTADGCADARISLGAYVLGALDPADRGRVDAHLAGCPECRDELAAFAALPGLLGRVSRAEVETEATAPGPQLLDRLLTAAVGERRRDRRTRWLSSVAAAVIALAAIGVAVGVSRSHHTAATSSVAAGGRVFTATDATTHVTASITEWKKGWGAALEVKLSGLNLPTYGYKCQLVAVGSDGQTDIAASWAAPKSGGKIVANGATALAAADITWFKIVASDGMTLVSIPAPWNA
jgi:Putative zinc-finger